MDFFEVVEKRHSYRGDFHPQPVPPEDIRKIMEAGVRAPSGVNLQPTWFVVVTEPPLMGQLRELVPNKAMATAPAAVVVVSQRVPLSNGMDFEVQDYSACIENILLAMTALGYASVWVEGQTRAEDRNKAVGRLLGVPEDKTVQVLLPFGRPVKEFQQQEKKPYEERVRYNRWE